MPTPFATPHAIAIMPFDATLTFTDALPPDYHTYH